MIEIDDIHGSFQSTGVPLAASRFFSDACEAGYDPRPIAKPNNNKIENRKREGKGRVGANDPRRSGLMSFRLRHESVHWLVDRPAVADLAHLLRAPAGPEEASPESFHRRLAESVDGRYPDFVSFPCLFFVWSCR